VQQLKDVAQLAHGASVGARHGRCELAATAHRDMLCEWVSTAASTLAIIPSCCSENGRVAAPQRAGQAPIQRVAPARQGPPHRPLPGATPVVVRPNGCQPDSSKYRASGERSRNLGDLPQPRPYPRPEPRLRRSPEWLLRRAGWRALMLVASTYHVSRARASIWHGATRRAVYGRGAMPLHLAPPQATANPNLACMDWGTRHSCLAAGLFSETEEPLPAGAAEAAQAQGVGDHADAGGGHGGPGHDRAEQAEGGQGDRGHVVAEGPTEVLDDRAVGAP
jgi:hypothetical protein